MWRQPAVRMAPEGVEVAALAAARSRPRWAVFLSLLTAALAGALGATPAPDGARMDADVRWLAVTVGPRPAGSAAEAEVARQIAARFAALGYRTRLQPFPLPNGRHSVNVIADSGVGPPRLIIGGHHDSRANTPGAHDNASGIAVILEVARLLAERRVPVQFVTFGAEEMIDRNPEHHHYGSRAYVGSAPRALLSGLRGMLCIDSVGGGRRLRIVGMPRGSDELARRCRQSAWRRGLQPGAGRGSALSDHEAFAAAGVPVALFHRVPFPERHTPRDTPDRVRAANLIETAAAVQAVVTDLLQR